MGRAAVCGHVISAGNHVWVNPLCGVDQRDRGDGEMGRRVSIRACPRNTGEGGAPLVWSVGVIYFGGLTRTLAGIQLCSGLIRTRARHSLLAGSPVNSDVAHHAHNS